MTREIKFRQPITNSKGVFIEWFYWGFIDGDFITPALQSNGYDSRPESKQYTGRKDKKGNEIYDGSSVRVKGTKRIGEYVTSVVWRNQSFELAENETYYIDSRALIAVIEVIG